jgi:hypothetical protein
MPSHTIPYPNEEDGVADEFNPTPQAGALLEMPEVWEAHCGAGEQQPALTDERILQIAMRHRNHTLTAQSGTRLDVIEHAALVAFAREIEGAVLRRQVPWRAIHVPLIAYPLYFANFGHLSFISFPRQP